EIPYLRYRMEKDFSICTEPSPFVYLETYQRNSDGTWTLIAQDDNPNNNCGQGSFSPENVDCLEEGALLDMLPCLEADRDYLFEIVFSHAEMTFEIFKETTTTETGNQLVGGLRIKQIRTHDVESSANDVIKTYSYDHLNEVDKSSGLLYSKPRYSYGRPYNVGAVGDTYCGVLEGEIGMSLILKDVGIVPMGSFEGTHIGYQRVVESCNGNGSKEFRYLMEQSPYYTQADTSYEGFGYPLAPVLARVEAGNLELSTIWSEDQQTLQSTYNGTKPDPYTFSGRQFIKAEFIANTLMYSKYRLRTRPYRLQESISRVDGVVTNTTYEYQGNNHLAPTATNMTNSDGKVHRTEMDYPEE
ncbi:MAG: hypothetical protein AAFV95_28765, partial [Bacteroidota bacterium]